jgi:hypothetical protein
MIDQIKILSDFLKDATVEIHSNNYFNNYFMNANTIIANKNDEPKGRVDFKIPNYDNNMFKKPAESNSSITIKKVEKSNFDFKEIIKLDNFDFMSKLTNEINKKKNEDVKPVAANTAINLTKELNIEINNNKALSDVSRVSSVESFRQFNKKLSEKTHQTSSPLPKIPNFFNDFKFIKKSEAPKKTVNTEVNISESVKKSIGTSDTIYKDLGVIQRTTTTTTTNYTTDLNKYTTSFDLFEGVSNISESLNNLHKKIGAPTLNLQQSPVQENLIDRKMTNEASILNLFLSNLNFKNYLFSEAKV